jgi:hypothetical protein
VDYLNSEPDVRQDVEGEEDDHEHEEEGAQLFGTLKLELNRCDQKIDIKKGKNVVVKHVVVRANVEAPVK